MNAVADPLNLYLEQSGDATMFNNGSTHDHYVGNVFVFAPNDLIIGSTINAPGFVHDSRVCACDKLYNRLKELYETTSGNV